MPLADYGAQIQFDLDFWPATDFEQIFYATLQNKKSMTSIAMGVQTLEKYSSWGLQLKATKSNLAGSFAWI